MTSKQEIEAVAQHFYNAACRRHPYWHLASWDEASELTQDMWRAEARAALEAAERERREGK